MVVFQSMTIDEYASCYAMYQLLYAFHRTPFGKCLIAVTDIDDSVAYLVFIDDDDETEAVKDLKAKWRLTRILEDTENRTEAIITKIFHPDQFQSHSLRVLMKGTKFQIKVWECLMRIPRGTIITYQEVAQMIDCKAAIAVGSAISRNYVAYLVPCHRVTAKNIYARCLKYAWGMERKKAILKDEQLQAK